MVQRFEKECLQLYRLQNRELDKIKVSAIDSIIDDSVVYLEFLTSFDTETVTSYLMAQTSASENASDIYAGFSDGSFIDGTGWIPEADWDCRIRPWYTTAENLGTKIYGEPYLDVISNTMVIDVAKSFFLTDILDGKYLQALNTSSVIEDYTGQKVLLRDAAVPANGGYPAADNRLYGCYG